MTSYISISVVFLIYFSTVVMALTLAFKVYNYNQIFEPILFLIALGIACIINFFILRKILNTKRLLEYQNRILSSALESECEFYILLDENNKIVFLNKNLISQIQLLGGNLKINELESVFELLNIQKSVIQSLIEAINKRDNISINLDALISLKFTKIKLVAASFNVYESDNNNINFLNTYNKYYFIKATRINDDEESIEVINKIKCGYYELDEVGHITQCNDIFAMNLGFRREDIINNLINFSSFVQKDLNLHTTKEEQNSSHYLNNNWQGFITISNQFKEQIHALIIQKAFYSETRTIKKIVGYFVKLPDKTLITKARGVEEGWIDHSWECFFKNSPYPVAILNKSGKMIKINSALANMIERDASEETFLDLFTLESQEIISTEIQNIIYNTNPLPHHRLDNLKMNNGKSIGLYMSKILDLNGNLYGFMPRVVDISQQKELEESLSHALRMKTIGYLAGSIAHDFNNLLTAILGFCDLLLIRHTPKDQSFTHIMQIRQSATRAANLVNRLLAFSRKQTLTPTRLNVNEFFIDFYSLVQRLVGTDIRINQVIAPDLWNIKVDPVQFEQVMLNLVINAQQAIVTDGYITIKAHNITLKKHDPYLIDYITPHGQSQASARDYVAIEIEDNGMGIDPQIADKIFEPFFSTKQETSGTGLGLSTVIGIIIQSGGYIYFKTKVGVGTTFMILMPKHIKPATLSKLSSSPKKTEIRKDISGTECIVLVEDEEAVRIFAKYVLTHKGYEVIDFAFPKEAIDFLNSTTKKVDLVVTDVVMPGMNGPTLIEEIKRYHPKIHVIFISGFGEEAFTQAYGDIRDFNFLPKPFSFKDLLIKVRKVLDDRVG